MLVAQLEMAELKKVRVKKLNKKRCAIIEFDLQLIVFLLFSVMIFTRFGGYFLWLI
jgi:hypothetical protein